MDGLIDIDCVFSLLKILCRGGVWSSSGRLWRLVTREELQKTTVHLYSSTVECVLC